jgi:hypothetical protein
MIEAFGTPLLLHNERDDGNSDPSWKVSPLKRVIQDLSMTKETAEKKIGM